MATEHATQAFRFELPWRRRIPVVLQGEVAECGLACLAMVAAHHGCEVDLAALRRRFGSSLQGLSFKQLIAHAATLELGARALRVDLAGLARLRGPAILHWDLNHFVVLIGVRRGRVLINDPARGFRSLDVAEVSRSFTGVALEFSPLPGFVPVREVTRLSLRQLWSSARGLASSVLNVVLLALTIQFLAALLPYFLQLTLDRGVAADDRALLTTLALGFALFNVIRVAAETLRAWAILYLGSSLNLQLGANLLRHLLKLPLAYFQKRHIGDLQSRFSALNAIRQTLTGGLIEGVIDGVMTLLMIVLMVAYSATLASIALGAALAYAALRALLFVPLRRATLEALVQRARCDSQFLETIRAIQPIRIFGREHERHTAWQNLQAEAINADARTAQWQIAYQACLGLITGLEYVVLVWLGARSVLGHGMSVGMLMAFIAYRQMFSQRCQTLTDKLIEYRMLGVHLLRLSEIALAEPEAGVEGQGLPTRTVPGEITLRGVGFRYSADDPWLFRDLDLTIRPGECIAFSGRTGRGKTTLLKVMMGLLAPSEGQVLLDGVDIRRIGLGAYRALCAAVMQDDSLLSGSLRDNICFHDAAPDSARVEACAERACIGAEVAQMPMGFESLIGDMGTSLSGGQQQRVLLARALYHAPKILFLDEATSALDAATEAAVNQNIRELGITRIIVAHRKETLALADRVIDLAGCSRGARRQG